MIDDFVTLRPVAASDNTALARIIRTVLAEFGAVGEGYACNDPETDAMFETYQAPGSLYLVAERNGTVVGGSGIAPLKGTPPEAGICELQKLYILPEARGKGLGRRLTQHCLDIAREDGYRLVYLETLPHMDTALALYRDLGFTELDQRLGDTGHHKCHCWYALPLENGSEQPSSDHAA